MIQHYLHRLDRNEVHLVTGEPYTFPVQVVCGISTGELSFVVTIIKGFDTICPKCFEKRGK